MSAYKEKIEVLNNIDKLDKKKILSVGCGSGEFEHFLMKNKHISSIECINKPMEYTFPFNDSLEKIKGFSYDEVDFITNTFKKKYDILLFINSIQFILGNNPKTIDIEYLNFINDKILDLLKPQGHILVIVTSKEWFQEHKPNVDPVFLTYLDKSLKNITKILKPYTKIILKQTNKYATTILFKTIFLRKS